MPGYQDGMPPWSTVNMYEKYDNFNKLLEDESLENHVRKYFSCRMVIFHTVALELFELTQDKVVVMLFIYLSIYIGYDVL